MATKSAIGKRWLYLVVGVFAMLFSGVLYAWSILNKPFSEVFEWSKSSLSLNFTLTMCFFCLGAFAGSLICKKIGPQITLIIAGLLVGIGFVLTGFLNAGMLPLLYISYALLAGTGIGISYNVIVSTVCAWFPDRKGFCSGCLMMGFGLSTLILGKVISFMFDNKSIGWSKTYISLGIVLAVVLIIAGVILRRPTANTVLPQPKQSKNAKKENFVVRDFSTAQMLKSFTFWRTFVCMAFITAVGNSVISFARPLVMSVGAAENLAVTLVGVLAVCNGLGRILTGAVFDVLGRRTTMISANILTIVAAGITLMAVMFNSLPLCIVGLCLTGMSYGSCPTVTSAFTASFYGQKYFAVNYSIMNFNLIVAAFIANFSNTLQIQTNAYTAPFVMLLILAVCALALNFTIRKPE
ncbi:MAG: MFS transporter [Acutalibacteraceae bacterium]|nr:MFS transporter [Acutalibacteraceae bacterium]